MIKKEKGKIILLQSIYHKLSEGSGLYNDAYYGITNNNSDKLLFYHIKDELLAFPIEEQIIKVAQKYFKKGYDIKIVTCRCDMANKAKLNGIEVEILSINNGGNIMKFENKNKIIENTEEETVLLDKITIPYITRGKQLYISTKNKIDVYDRRGIRRIAKNKLLFVQLSDTFLSGKTKYIIQKIEGENLILIKLCDI